MLRLLEAEQADHPVDVHRQDRLLAPPEDRHGGQGYGSAPLAIAATIRRRAEHEPTGPQGPKPQAQEDDDAGPQVGPGAQEARRRASAPGRLHARRHGDPEEAELGAAQDRPCAAHQPDGGHHLHPGRGPQPSGALRRAGPRRPRQGPSGRPLQGRARHARRRRRLGPQAGRARCYGVKAT